MSAAFGGGILSPQLSRWARIKRATLCRWFGHKPDSFEGWFGPAGADDADGQTFDLCICGRCYVSLTCRTCQYEWGEDTLDNLG